MFVTLLSINQLHHRKCLTRIFTFTPVTSRTSLKEKLLQIDQKLFPKYNQVSLFTCMDFHQHGCLFAARTSVAKNTLRLSGV